ncbi:MAG: argininosuccinate lyase [bacterium]|nr:argininosuccinate lyase [bacterium]
MKQWGGRFKEKSIEEVEKFTCSLEFDHRLYKYDIKGSIAHAEMLGRCGILKIEEAEKIIDSLKEIQREIEEKGIRIHHKYEDIHTYIENKLSKKIGELSGKLHTARSRNDQVALDVRLYLKDEIKEVAEKIKEVQKSIIKIAQENINIIMPGYTHMQQAEPVLFSHHIMAYFWMLQRDIKKLYFCLKNIDELPLGAAALAGTSFNINQEITSNLLDFTTIVPNSIDGVSNRDFIIDCLFIAALVMMHLSRFNEELIIWSTNEFNFIEIGDAFCTGSSIMPQKKNPDVCELIRGKCGRVYGNLISLLTTMKALPLSYNRDLQEDKEVLFNSIDILKNCLSVFSKMLLSIEINNIFIEKHLKNKYLCATEIANYLVKKGLTFRVAHEIVGKLILKSSSNNKSLDEITLDEFKEVCHLFEKDIYDLLDLKKVIDIKKSHGSTSREQVERQIKKAESIISN